MVPGICLVFPKGSKYPFQKDSGFLYGEYFNVVCAKYSSLKYLDPMGLGAWTRRGWF